MTAPDNEGSTTAFDGFATLIDDDNLPGFDSLNNSTFFDQVMNASKLFDGDASMAKLNESLAKLNDSFTIKSAARMNINKKKVDPMPAVEEPFFSVEEESIHEDEDEEKDETEAFEEQILVAFLQKKLKKKQRQEKESGKPAEDGESVTTATASLTSNASVYSAGSLLDTTKKTSDISAAPKTPKKKRSSKQSKKPATRTRSAEDQEAKSRVKSTRAHKKPSEEHQVTTPRRRQRRASLGSVSIPSGGMMDCSSIRQGGDRRMDCSSSRNRMSSTRRRDGSDRRGKQDDAAPETPRRKQRIRERSRSFGRSSTDEEAGSETPKGKKGTVDRRHGMELRRVTRTPKRGPRGVRPSLGHDILQRNFQIMDQMDMKDEPSMPAAEREQKHEVWKQRRARSFGDASIALQHHQKSTALEKATRLSTIQAATAATLKTPKAAKLSVNVDAALSRISQVGLQAKESIKNKSIATEAVSSKDDSCLAGLRRTATNPPPTPRRMRRRGSCV